MTLLPPVIHSLPTPFDAAGAVDIARFSGLAGTVRERYADVLLVASCAGEGTTLSLEERIGLMTAARSTGAGLVVSSEGCAAAEAVTLADALRPEDILLLTQPLYWDVAAPALAEHYRRVAEAAPGRILLLHDPVRAAPFAVALEAALTLPKAIGLVDLSRSIPAMSEAIRMLDSAGRGYFGTTPDAPIIAALGGTGIVSAEAIIVPHAVRTSADNCPDALVALWDLVARRPALLKAAAALVGYDVGDVRPPLLPPDSAMLDQLAALIRTFNEVENDPRFARRTDHADTVQIA